MPAHGSAGGPRPRAGLDKKKTVIGAIIGVVSLAVIFLGVIPQIGSYAEALTAIQAMTLGAIVLIVATVVVYNVGYGFPFMAATPGLPYGQAFQLNQGAFAISNGIPAGGAFGVGVQYAMLETYGVAPAAATAAIGAVSVWSLLATLGLPVLGLIAIAASGTIAVGPYAIVGLVCILALLVLVVGFGLVIHSERLAERLGRLANTIARPVVSRSKKHRDLDFVPMLLDFRHSVVDLIRRRRASLTATRLLVSFTEFLIFLAALRGVESQGPHTSFLVAFGAWAVAQIGHMIPITPGGLGTVDALLIALLTAMGVPDGDATAADLVWRAASYVQQIVIGVLCLVTWSKRAAKTFAAAPREYSGRGSGAAVPPDLARRRDGSNRAPSRRPPDNG